MTRPLLRLALGLLVLATTAHARAEEETPTPGVPPVKTLATGIALPWSMAFLPDGGLLIVEKAGGLRRFANGVLEPGRIEGLPVDLLANEQSGLHDIALDPQTGEVWESEHGPLGGDEVNRLRAGANYGWPRLTGGIDYDGTLISERAHAPDAESPLIMWSPSIAPSGLAVYRGTRIPGWDGQFLIGALADKALVLAALDNEGRTIRETTRALAELGARIRDVRVGPDGAVWLLTDEQEGRLLRLAAED